MNVTCPNCSTIYRVDPAKVPESGVRARCAVCSAVFAVRRDLAEAVALPSVARTPEPAPSAAVAEPVRSAPPVPVAEAPTPVSPPEPARPSAPPIAPAAPPAAAPPPQPARPAAPRVVMPPPAIPRGSRTGSAPRPAAPPSGPRPAAPAPRPPGPTAAVQVPPPPPAPPAPLAPPPTPPAAQAPRPVNPFLSQDPASKARRLARALISDMVVYHPAKRQEGLRAGTLRQLFEEEIRKSWEEYSEQVGDDLANSTPFFRDALNEILADGQQIF